MRELRLSDYMVSSLRHLWKIQSIGMISLSVREGTLQALERRGLVYQLALTPVGVHVAEEFLTEEDRWYVRYVHQKDLHCRRHGLFYSPPAARHWLVENGRATAQRMTTPNKAKESEQ